MNVDPEGKKNTCRCVFFFLFVVVVVVVDDIMLSEFDTGKVDSYDLHCSS